MMWAFRRFHKLLLPFVVLALTQEALGNEKVLLLRNMKQEDCENAVRIAVKKSRSSKWDLSGSELSVRCFQLLSNAQQIRDLTLYGIGLDQEKLRILSQMKQLMALRLQTRTLSRQIMDGISLPYIKTFVTLDFPNEVTPNWMDEFVGTFPNVQSVSFLSVRFHRNTIAKLSQLRQLTTLDLSHCRMGDREMKSLRSSSIEDLKLTGCDISGAGLSSIRKFKNLKCLDVADTFVDGNAKGYFPELEIVIVNVRTEAGLARIAEVGSLTEAIIEVDGDLRTQGLERLRNLKSLSLFDAKLSAECLKSWEAMPKLRSLSFGSVRAAEPIMKRIFEHQNELQTLYISNSMISPAVLQTISKGKHLENLTLLSCPLNDMHVPGLVNLKRIKELSVDLGIGPFGKSKFSRASVEKLRKNGLLR